MGWRFMPVCVPLMVSCSSSCLCPPTHYLVSLEHTAPYPKLQTQTPRLNLNCRSLSLYKKSATRTRKEQDLNRGCKRGPSTNVTYIVSSPQHVTLC